MTGEDEAFRDSVFEILLSSHDLVENARALAEKAGYFTVVDNSCDDWDYADAARYLLERFHALRALHPRLCLISVGEVTVTMDRTPGAGGRNQQFAMACALDLEKYQGERLTVLSAGSDGIDGNTQSAGAIADPTTVARAHAFGFHLKESLAAFNACPMFTRSGRRGRDRPHRPEPARSPPADCRERLGFGSPVPASDPGAPHPRRLWVCGSCG